MKLVMEESEEQGEQEEQEQRETGAPEVAVQLEAGVAQEMQDGLPVQSNLHI
ncbi:MAG: hypothetical protein FWD58_08440 [Firmicutes bacterium]|nr:hypothetical protein [Bacillota bacterium]